MDQRIAFRKKQEMTRRYFLKLVALVFSAVATFPIPGKKCGGKTYFVDANRGQDCFSGLSPKTPFRTSDRAWEMGATRVYCLPKEYDSETVSNAFRYMDVLNKKASKWTISQSK